jgi:hypothetical protein
MITSTSVGGMIMPNRMLQPLAKDSLENLVRATKGFMDGHTLDGTHFHRRHHERRRRLGIPGQERRACLRLP